MTLSDKIDSLMMKVTKPVRYVGGEFGSIMKDPEKVDVRYAFLFPDTYEVGMSHLGMKILYHTINDRDDAWCERVFSPWVDMEEKMRELDKQGALNGDVIDGILSEQKKEVDKVIINSAELEKYFGKDKSPREMKDKIMSLLDDWKAKQPPELGKPDKKKNMEK